MPHLLLRRERIAAREESLCDVGASEILMPQDILVRHASSADQSCGTELLRLCRVFEVSAKAMAVRLVRESSIWPTVVNFWRPRGDESSGRDSELAASWRCALEGVFVPLRASRPCISLG